MRAAPSRVGLGLLMGTCTSLMATGLAHAGQDPFTSDQPGFANATSIAPKHQLITEFRVSATPLEEAPGVAFPGTSFRFGLAPWLELRWRAPHMLLTQARDYQGRAHFTLNLADPILGFKVGTAVSPSVAISSVTELSLPLGTGGMQAQHAGWGTDLNLDWTFTKDWTLTPNLVVASEWAGDRHSGDRRMAAALSLACAWQFAPQVGAFTQLYSWFRNREPQNLQWGLGLVWRVRSYAQLDASVNIPVVQGNEAARIGFGATIYWRGLKEAPRAAR